MNMDIYYKVPDKKDRLRDTDMDSFVEIELYNNKPFMAGTLLYGTVHLYCKEDISDVKQVSLTFMGEEQINIHLPEVKGGPVKPC